MDEQLIFVWAHYPNQDPVLIATANGIGEAQRVWDDYCDLVDEHGAKEFEAA